MLQRIWCTAILRARRLPPSTTDRSQCRLTTPRHTKHIHELSYRAQVLQMVDGFDRPLDHRGGQHAFRIGAEFAGDPGASKRVLGAAAGVVATGGERASIGLYLDQ